jgi:hypothetical protein
MKKNYQSIAQSRLKRIKEYERKLDYVRQNLEKDLNESLLRGLHAKCLLGIGDERVRIAIKEIAESSARSALRLL